MKDIKLYNDLGFCLLVDHLGDDWRVVEAARHSYGSSARKGVEQDTKLIEYLMTNKHTSPFEQCSMTFNLRMPIFVMRQFVRHRTFRLNEESARYTQMREDFYVPKRWRAQDTTNKQSSSDQNTDPLWHQTWTFEVEKFCKHAYHLYTDMLADGIAREQARCILPVNLMTTIIVNIDLHNLMNFFRLRLDSHAQLEIRVLASAMYHLFKSTYPVICEAFTKTLSDTQQPIQLHLLNS